MIADYKTSATQQLKTAGVSAGDVVADHWSLLPEMTKTGESKYDKQETA